MRMLLAAAGFLLLFALAQVVHARREVPAEATRKSVHIVAGMGALVLPLFLGRGEIVALGIAFTILLAGSRWRRVLTAIHDVPRRTWGEVLYPAGVVATALVASEVVAFSYGVGVLAFGDGFAGVVGQRARSPGYRIGSSEKSLAGSLTFLLISWAAGIVALAWTGVSLPAAIGVALGSALVLTALEGVLPLGLDNLVLPVAAALALGAVLPALR